MIYLGHSHLHFRDLGTKFQTIQIPHITCGTTLTVAFRPRWINTGTHTDSKGTHSNSREIRTKAVQPNFVFFGTDCLDVMDTADCQWPALARTSTEFLATGPRWGPRVEIRDENQFSLCTGSLRALTVLILWASKIHHTQADFSEPGQHTRREEICAFALPPHSGCRWSPQNLCKNSKFTHLLELRLLLTRSIPSSASPESISTNKKLAKITSAVNGPPRLTENSREKKLYPHSSTNKVGKKC